MEKYKDNNVERYMNLVKEMSGNGEDQGGDQMNQFKGGGTIPIPRFQTGDEWTAMDSDMHTWSYGSDRGLGSLFSPTMWNYITWDRDELEFQNNVRIWNKYTEEQLKRSLGDEKFNALERYIKDWKKSGKGKINGFTGRLQQYEPYEWRFGGDLPKFQYKKSEVIDAGSGNTYTDVEGENLVLDRESDARDYLNADLLSKGWDIRHANEIKKNIELGYDVGYGNEDETTDGIYNKYTKDFRINQLANTKEFLGRPIHYNAESFMDKLSLNKNYFRNVAGVSIPGHGISDEFNLMSDKWRAQEYPRIYYGENIGGRRLNIPTGYDFTNLRQHELGHAMLNNVEGITPYASELLTRSKTFSEDRSNISYKDWIAQGHGGPKPTRKIYRKWKNVSSGDYLTDDSEVYTRYKIAQKDLKNKGIFDAFSGKTFTDDDYNKVQEYINSEEYKNVDSNVKQFFGTDEYDPRTGEYNKKIEKEDLIEIMNNVADLSTGMPAGMSKYGTELPKAQNSLETLWNSTKDIYNQGKDLFNIGAKKVATHAATPVIGNTIARSLGLVGSAYGLLDANLNFDKFLIEQNTDETKSDSDIRSNVDEMYSGIYGSTHGLNPFYGNMKQTGGSLPKAQKGYETWTDQELIDYQKKNFPDMFASRKNRGEIKYNKYDINRIRNHIASTIRLEERDARYAKSSADRAESAKNNKTAFGHLMSGIQGAYSGTKGIYDYFTGDKTWNDEPDYGVAFNKAKAAGNEEFLWNNQLKSTMTKEDYPDEMTRDFWEVIIPADPRFKDYPGAIQKLKDLWIELGMKQIWTDPDSRYDPQGILGNWEGSTLGARATTRTYNNVIDIGMTNNNITKTGARFDTVESFVDELTHLMFLSKYDHGPKGKIERTGQWFANEGRDMLLGGIGGNIMDLFTQDEEQRWYPGNSQSDVDLYNKKFDEETQQLIKDYKKNPNQKTYNNLVLHNKTYSTSRSTVSNGHYGYYDPTPWKSHFTSAYNKTYHTPGTEEYKHKNEIAINPYTGNPILWNGEEVIGNDAGLWALIGFDPEWRNLDTYMKEDGAGKGAGRHKQGSLDRAEYYDDMGWGYDETIDINAGAAGTDVYRVNRESGNLELDNLEKYPYLSEARAQEYVNQNMGLFPYVDGKQTLDKSISPDHYELFRGVESYAKQFDDIMKRIDQETKFRQMANTFNVDQYNLNQFRGSNTIFPDYGYDSDVRYLYGEGGQLPKAQESVETIYDGGMLPEIEISALTDDSFNKLSDPQQKVYDMYVNKYGTRQTIPTGKNTAMHWKDALRMVDEQGLKTLSHESSPIFNRLFNRGSVESAEAGRFTPHATPMLNKITIPDYKAQDYSSYDRLGWLGNYYSIDELKAIDVKKIKNIKTYDDADELSKLEWKLWDKYNKNYTYGHEEDVKSGRADFDYYVWDQRNKDDMHHSYMPDDVDLQEIIDNKIEQHKRNVADIPGNRSIDMVIAELAHITESDQKGSNVQLIISLLRDWQRIKKVPFKKMKSHLDTYERTIAKGTKFEKIIKQKNIKSWSQLWDWLDDVRYSDPNHYEHITHQFIEPWLRKEYNYNPTGITRNNPMPKSKYDTPLLNTLFESKFNEGGEVVKHTIVKGDNGKRLETMYGTNFKDILKHNDLTYFKLGAEIEIPKYQDKGQWNPTDVDAEYTYEDLYGENWETIINDLKAGEQKVYPWQGSSVRNQTSTGKDPTYWNEDGTFKTANQLVTSMNKQFPTIKTKTKKVSEKVEEDRKRNVGTTEFGDKFKYPSEFNWESDLNIDDQYNSYKDWVTKGENRALTQKEKHGFTFAQQNAIGQDEHGSDKEITFPTEWSDEKYQSDLTSMNQGNNTGYTWLPNKTIGEQMGSFTDWVTNGESRDLTKKERDLFIALRDNSGEYSSPVSNVGASKSIMFGNAYGTRPIGTQGVFGDAIDATFGMDEIKAGKYDWLLGNTETGGAPGAWTSNLLDVLSIPASLVSEGIEGIGGYGDKEFNISDVVPGFSGNFSFTNTKGEPTKRVSDVLDMQDSPWYSKFAVDLVTDPLSWITLGSSGVARSGARSLVDDLVRTTVRSSDDIVKKGVKSTDDLLKTPLKKTKEQTRLDDFNITKKNTVIDTDKTYRKSAYGKDSRTTPVRGGHQFDDIASEYNWLDEASKIDDHVVSPLNPRFNESGSMISFDMTKLDDYVPFTKHKMQFPNVDVTKFKTDLTNTVKKLQNQGYHHMDMHGGNVLVKTDNLGNIVDYKIIDPVGYSHKFQKSESFLKNNPAYQNFDEMIKSDQWSDDLFRIKSEHFKYGGSLPKFQDEGEWWNNWDVFEDSKFGKFVDAQGFERMFGMDQGISGQLADYFGYGKDQGGDMALDATAIVYPAADFAHAATKFDEGKYTDASLYALFGILPFTAGPLVRGTKKHIINPIKEFFSVPAATKIAGETATHTYNPISKKWIEKNAVGVNAKLLANETEFLIKQDYLKNKVIKLQQSKIKITNDIKKFKIDNPGKTIPNDLTKVDNVINGQLDAYTKQLNNVPPIYTPVKYTGDGPFGLQFDEFGKKWKGSTVKSSYDDAHKKLMKELNKAEKLDLQRMIGDYKWDDRNILQKYFNTAAPPFNINELYEKPYWFQP